MYAIFDDSEGRYFPEKFLEYKSSEKNDNNFIRFTRNVIGNLEPVLQQVTMATGRYFVFTEYNSNGNDFWGVFLIRDTEGKYFSPQ